MWIKAWRTDVNFRIKIEINNFSYIKTYIKIEGRYEFGILSCFIFFLDTFSTFEEFHIRDIGVED